MAAKAISQVTFCKCPIMSYNSGSKPQEPNRLRDIAKIIGEYLPDEWILWFYKGNERDEVIRSLIMDDSYNYRPGHSTRHFLGDKAELVDLVEVRTRIIYDAFVDHENNKSPFLQEKIFYVLIPYLNVEELHNAESVCRQWKRLINSPDQAVWRQACVKRSLSLPYIQSDLRPYALALKGCVEINDSGEKELSLGSYNHGVHEEAGLGVDIHNGDVTGGDSRFVGVYLNQDRRKHPTMFSCRHSFFKNKDSGITTVYTIATSVFPLKWFYDPNGNQKKKGDKIQIVYKEQPMALILGSEMNKFKRCQAVSAAASSAMSNNSGWWNMPTDQVGFYKVL